MAATAKRLTLTITTVETRPQRHLVITNSPTEEKLVVDMARAAKVPVFHSDHKTELLGKLGDISAKLAKVGLVIEL